LEDLYVCTETTTSLRGCLGSIYNAIDYVCENNRKSTTCFCAIRPPGHHATKESPMGFCFINNVVVGSIYAHKKYQIHRIAILDIDLHHGNGTQELVRQLNKRNPPKETEKNKSLKLFYGSLHDILSYPCETGKDSYIDAASLCLMDHGQYIWNIHLDSWKTLQDFEQSYTEKYSHLLKKTESFFKGHDPRYCLIMISAGFDAHEMEDRNLQRYNRNLPNCFYYKFTADLMKLSEVYCDRKIVSILEGGYSDSALRQGSCGHLGAFMNLSLEESTLPVELVSSPPMSPNLSKRLSRRPLEENSPKLNSTMSPKS
jgi:histone deacetylase HOS3